MKELQLIDTHAHLDLEEFESDHDDVINRSFAGDFPLVRNRPIMEGPVRFRMAAIISPGVSAASSQASVAFSRRFPRFYSAVAIHPNYTSEATEDDWRTIEKLAAEPKVVGIGETGLDRYWDKSPFSLQVTFFRRHLELARRKNLPVLIHCREAAEDLMPLLREAVQDTSNHQISGIIHSFSGDPEMAMECIELGFHLGFSGSLTYTNKKYAPTWEAARLIPKERILLETDSPFLVPHPFRGKLERNEPLMTAFVAKRLAELRGCLCEEIIQQTTENAIRLFGLDFLSGNTSTNNTTETGWKSQ